MSVAGAIVRGLRHATDPIAPFAFNRIGFEMNRRGFFPGDIPTKQSGRIALVTGANSGIGRATALELARLDYEVWLLCRDAKRGEEARSAIAQETGSPRVHLALVDVSDLSSLRRFAATCPVDRVDVLVHNAGVLPDRKIASRDGVELTFATSVLGPYALTQLLLPCLRRSEDARVVFVASGGLYAQRLDLDLLDVGEDEFDGVRAYANAKRAQVILARLLAERARAPITFASMHPGWVDTTALRGALPRFYALMKDHLRTPAQGADTVVWLAASARPRLTPGAFWFDRRRAPTHLLPWTRETRRERERLLAVCELLSGLRSGGPRADLRAMPPGRMITA